MLVPFQKETLSQPNFLRQEARHNLLNTISGGELVVALQAEDGGAIALANPGRNLWLWVDELRGEGYAAALIAELAERLGSVPLPGVVAAPEIARLFSQAYCGNGASASLFCSFMSYACPRVSLPATPGGMERAGEEYRDLVAEFLRGFQWDCFHTELSPEEALSSACAMIEAGKPYVWLAEGNPVCMAAIAQRSARQVRIGYVYTKPAERCKGYAAALVAALSKRALDEGLLPVLYADIANPASNKAYRNIGYIPAGQVDEYHFSH